MKSQSLTRMQLQRALMRMKMLDKENPNVSSIVYNLTLIENLFKEIGHIGASNTIQLTKILLNRGEGE